MKPEELSETSVSLSMQPYSGAWTKEEAAHLLKRTLFGPTNQQMLDAVNNGMNATVATLLSINPINPPLTYDPFETISPIGTTWINSVYPSGTIAAQNVETARLKSLGAWVMERLNNLEVSIAEKMCLFWHNHFAASAASDSRATYNYHMLLRSHALGNFRQMVKDITIDPCMLLFLNGATNNVYSPNENYARELLELFTIGKGPQLAAGDYTNYTEEDVAAGAKILTGYTVDGLRSTTLPSPIAVYYSVLHDNSTKQLSYHFNNATISNDEATEYQNYIDVIFQQAAVAEYICTKLYRYFVNYDITLDVQTNVISAMSATLIANNYEILPVMDELLKSEHFYDITLRGAIIRSPLEVIFGMFNATESAPNFDLATNSDMYLNLYYVAETMTQSYASPPSVAGWTAYYQAPAFSKLWVNSTTIKTRFDISNYVTVLTGIPVNGFNLKLNSLQFYNNLSLPDDPISAINEMCDVFFPKPISDTKKTALKALLTNGLSDATWAYQYQQYVGGDTTLEASIALRINVVLARIFKMPEFQMI